MTRNTRMGGTGRGYGQRRSTPRARVELWRRSANLTIDAPDCTPTLPRVVRHAPLAGLRIVHFGHFDPSYSRNRLVSKALRRAGAEVRIITDPSSFVRRTPRLLRGLHRTPADLVVIGFPGHADVIAAKMLARLRRTPVMFDAFVSLQESAEDRGSAQPGSARWRRLTVEDFIACRLADRVLVDTDAHGEHFVRDLGTDPRRVRRLWVGADDELMHPLPVYDHDAFCVFVYATFIPLHGLEHVVRAASILEAFGVDVRFDVVGEGDTSAEIRALAQQLGVRSLRFLGRRPYDELPGLMARSDLCLGIFGTSSKARRVIPNKVFDALACARPVITADSPAARELLQHGHDAWLCAPGDPTAIADAIATLRSDEDLRRTIGTRGYERFMHQASIDALARDLADIVLELV